MNIFNYTFLMRVGFYTAIFTAFALSLFVVQVSIRYIVVNNALDGLMEKHPEIKEQFVDKHISANEFVKCLKRQKIVKAENTTMCMNSSANI